MAGRIGEAGRSLLPQSLVSLLPRPPRGERVELGRFEALRYEDLRPFGLDGVTTVYAIPTDTGVILMACRDRGDPTFSGDCKRVAETLRLSGMKAVPLPPPAKSSR